MSLSANHPYQPPLNATDCLTPISEFASVKKNDWHRVDRVIGKAGNLVINRDRRSAGHEDIIIIRNDENNPPENEIWHADMSYLKMPIFASVLHGVKIPPAGGDTLWVDMAAIAADLSAPMASFLRSLTASHTIEQGFSFVADLGQNDRAATLAKSINENSRANHPVTGIEALFVNAAFTVGINELSRNESDDILRHLYQLINHQRYQLRVKWQPGTVIMWDNWATQHFACGDHYPAPREMQRVTVGTPCVDYLH